jgi:peptidoglycan hydrolase-like amidase/peptidoglycan hydrolase CwlO-like protein
MKSKIFELLILIVGIWYLIPKLFINAAPDCLNPDSITSNDDRNYCIDEIERLKNQYLPAQETNKKNLVQLQSELTNLNKRIQVMSNQLKLFEKNINQREEDMAYTQKIFEEKTSDYYKSLRIYEPFLLIILSSSDMTDAFRGNMIRQKVTEGDRNAIEKYVEEIAQLKKDKDNLEKNKSDLAAVQKQVADKEKFLAAEVAKVETYLAALTAKQQAFLAAKLESLGLSRSAYNMKGGCSSDINPFKSPGFSPAFGFFTFGVPNRVGLNQFGAKARAESGQDYDQILRAYYNADVISGYSTAITIHVVGKNEFGQSFNDYWNIEDYLKHLYEMPAEWDMKALKAQAIAARSYALSYTNNGSSSICPSQQCQVVKKELNNGRWQEAVDSTRGVVLTNGGQPIKAWFSSTHGGYAYNSGDIGWSATSWTKRMVDTTSGIGSFSDLQNNAYDKGSPVFYCDWGSRASYNKTAWLKPEEVADIVNVILLVQKDPSTKSHLYQVDKTNPEGTDTWDAGRVKNELGGSAFNTISDVSIGADFGIGRTTSVNVNGDAGSRTINGDDFKTYFNLRAPANIQIVGPLYNIEKR